MPENQDTQQLLAKSSKLIKSARDQISQLSQEVTERDQKIGTFQKQVKAAGAYGEQIVDGLIAMGRLDPSLREKALGNIGNPEKTAAALADVIKAVGEVRPVGRVDGTKQGSDEEDDRIAACDQRFLQEAGLA